MTAGCVTPTEDAGCIIFTFVDHDANEFVSLGCFSFRRPLDLAVAWAGVPDSPDNPDSPWLADLHYKDEGMIESRGVTEAFIEERAGRPIAELLAEGRAWNRDQQAMIRKAVA